VQRWKHFTFQTTRRPSVRNALAQWRSRSARQ
jgi:hypothetical protein